MDMCLTMRTGRHHRRAAGAPRGLQCNPRDTLHITTLLDSKPSVYACVAFVWQLNLGLIFIHKILYY